VSSNEYVAPPESKNVDDVELEPARLTVDAVAW
jgi:hypothetical protein